jgi:magnesium-transporting ATPase (P-type)
MTKQSRLDDPEYAEFAWRRYWRMMRWMVVFTVFMTICVLTAFYLKYGMVSIHLYIATAGAIITAILLTGALMGLVFLSSGSGHDECIEDPFKGEADK